MANNKDNKEQYPYTRYERRGQLNQWGSYDYPLVEAARVIGPNYEYRIKQEPGGSISYILQPRKERQKWQKL